MLDKKLEKILALVSLVLIIVAGVLGTQREAKEVKNYLLGIIPEGYRADHISGDSYVLYGDGDLNPDFYLINESAPGYGGKIQMSVLVDTIGVIEDLKLSRHRETPSFLEKTEKSGLRRSLIGKSYKDPFVMGEDVDVVSGASYTSEAIIQCARAGSNRIARYQLHLQVSALEAPTLKIGMPEISLVALYILALFGIYSKTRYKKVTRWITMLLGLFILGFWFSVPLTLSKINAFLLGYFPDWHTQIFWYLLVGGFLITLVLTKKNIYCNWICPLVGLQECLGSVGGAKPKYS